MGDWAQSQDCNQIVISPCSPESLGSDLVVSAAGSFSSGAWPAANRAIYIPFQVQVPLTIVKIGIFNGTTASGNLDAGVVDEQQNRIVSMGSTAQSGTNAIQPLDITDTLIEPGGYYMTLAMDGTTGTVLKWAPAVALCSAAGVLSQSLGSVTIPDPVTFAAAQDAFIPGMFLTCRTVI